MSGAEGNNTDLIRVELPRDSDRVGQLEAEILDAIDRHGYPKASKFAVKLAFEEAVTNAFEHGHRGLPEGLPIYVAYRVTGDAVVIHVEDQGPGFDPEGVPDPTLDENLAIPSGRGIMLMGSYMTSVEYNDRGNVVRMRYERSGAV